MKSKTAFFLQDIHSTDGMKKVDFFMTLRLLVSIIFSNTHTHTHTHTHTQRRRIICGTRARKIYFLNLTNKKHCHRNSSETGTDFGRKATQKYTDDAGLCRHGSPNPFPFFSLTAGLPNYIDSEENFQAQRNFFPSAKKKISLRFRRNVQTLTNFAVNTGRRLPKGKDVHDKDICFTFNI